MATALTAYLTNTADTLVTTSNTIVTTAPAAAAGVSNLLGTSTGWSIWNSQSNSSPWQSLGAEPAASSNGWLLDSTILENNTLLGGTFSPSMRTRLSGGTAAATYYMRIWKRSSGGSYTLIGKYSYTASLTSAYIVVTSGWTTVVAPTDTSFNTGDKLFIDYAINVTANSTGSTAATLFIEENAGSNDSLITQGYSPTSSGAIPTNAFFAFF